MKHCKLEMLGCDGQNHTVTLEADSLFDAANKAIQAWAKFWWYSREGLITVEADGQRWRVNQEAVRAWRDRVKKSSQFL